MVEINDRKLRETSIFLVKLLLAGAVFRAVIFLNPDTYLIQSYLAEITKQTVNFMGLGIERDGIFLLGDGKSFVVDQDCLGWKSMSVFTALIFASANNFLKHWKTLLTGLLILSLANLLRVVSTVYLSYIGVISFDLIHNFLWQWGLSFIVLAVWVYWLKNIQNP